MADTISNIPTTASIGAPAAGGGGGGGAANTLTTPGPTTAIIINMNLIDFMVILINDYQCLTNLPENVSFSVTNRTT